MKRPLRAINSCSLRGLKVGISNGEYRWEGGAMDGGGVAVGRVAAKGDRLNGGGV